METIETVAAGAVLEGIVSRAGLTVDEFDAELFRTLKGSLGRRLREGWFWQKWPVLTEVEKRYFRPIALQSEEVQSGTQRFVPFTDKYYQALKVTSDYPAQPESGETMTSWAELKTSYSATVQGQWWRTGEQYQVGDIVRFNRDDQYYQAHAIPPVNLPPKGDTLSAEYWGHLAAFERLVEYNQMLSPVEATLPKIPATRIGTVFGVTKESPRLKKVVCPVDFSLTPRGVLVLEPVSSVWIEFRVPAPKIQGDLWKDDREYETGEVVYFKDTAEVPDPAFADGDFFVCGDAALAGESPLLASGKWERQLIPAFLEKWLVSAGYADYLESDGEKDKANAELGAGRLALEDEWLIVAGQSQQEARTEVGTR